MKNDLNLLDFQTSINELDERQEKLRIRETRLVELLDKQNERFEKLWKGYKKLGLVDMQQELIKPMLQQEFYKELKVFETYFDEISIQSLNKKNLQNTLEQNIADLLTLLQSRWNTICAYKKLWRERRVRFRQEEIFLIENDYSTLSKSDMNNSLWFGQAHKLILRHKQLFEEQKKLIMVEEEQQNEFESIYEWREYLFTIAEQLFLL